MKFKHYLKENLISIIPTLKFEPITDEVWEIIQIDGLDDEFNKNKSHWSYVLLDIPKEDRISLQQMNPNIIEKYNRFDIDLKEKYKMKYIDLIDYDKGIIRIVKHD